MKILEVENKIIFKFNALKSLTIDRDSKVVKYWDGKINFDDIIGYWKNYHPGGKLFVYYIMLLTRNRIHKITPEIEEEDSIDKILDILKATIPREVKE